MTRNAGRLVVAMAALAGVAAGIAFIRPEVRRAARRLSSGQADAVNRWARDLRRQLDAAEDSLRQSAEEFARRVGEAGAPAPEGWEIDRADVLEDLPRLPHGRPPAKRGRV